MTCPLCNYENNATAKRCYCGYEFPPQRASVPPVAPPPPRDHPSSRPSIPPPRSSPISDATNPAVRPFSAAKLGQYIVVAVFAVLFFYFLFEYSVFYRRYDPKAAEPTQLMELTPVETLLIGRWRTDWGEVTFTKNRQFAEKTAPGFFPNHNPETGTWRLSAGNKLVEKYDRDGFEEWTIISITTGNLRMERDNTALDFRRGDAFTGPDPNSLESQAKEQIAGRNLPVGSPERETPNSNAEAVGDAVSRLLVGKWGDENNTVFDYHADHTLTLSNTNYPSDQYNNKGRWRMEGDRLVLILADNRIDVRRLVSITADKMVNIQNEDSDKMTWVLAHLTPVDGIRNIDAVERAAEGQLATAQSAREKSIADADHPGIKRDQSAHAAAPASIDEKPPEPKIQGPPDAVIQGKLRTVMTMALMEMDTVEYKRGTPLVSTGGQIPMGTTLYPIRISKLAAGGPKVSDVYFFEDEFGEWKCLWQETDQIF